MRGAEHKTATRHQMTTILFEEIAETFRCDWILWFALDNNICIWWWDWRWQNWKRWLNLHAKRVCICVAHCHGRILQPIRSEWNFAGKNSDIVLSEWGEFCLYRQSAVCVTSQQRPTPNLIADRRKSQWMKYWWFSNNKTKTKTDHTFDKQLIRQNILLTFTIYHCCCSRYCRYRAIDNLLIP